jgi:TPR repeat protein
MDAVLADPSSSRAVLIGVHTYTVLDDLPAVQRNLLRLKKIFTDSALWGLPSDHCQIVDQPDSSTTVMDSVASAAADAQDTLLIYYAGHGLTSSYKFDELYLALPDASKKRLYAALEYDWIRRLLLDAKALRKIVILDCCYSGRALSGAMGDAEGLADQAIVEGTAILVAAAETAQALAPKDEEFTAFTGELIKALEKGIQDGPELLGLDALYPHLLKVLKAEGRPEPQQRNRNMGGSIAIARNRAFVRSSKGTVAQWDPFDLGVHRAIAIEPKMNNEPYPKLPQYIIRQHDLDLDKFLASHQGNTMAVLVGSASTGKTRTAYEAVLRNFSRRPLLRITETDQLVDYAIAGRLTDASVVWLDEAQLVLTNEGGETASKILERILLGNAGGPIAIIGTMWPEFWQTLVSPPIAGEDDPYYRFRSFAEIAVGYFPVPDTLATFDVPNDPRLVSAIRVAGENGGVIQVLSGSPFMIERYLRPGGEEGKFERAILTAAIDVRRLGYLSPLPVSLLAEAAVAYLDKDDLARAPQDWFVTGLHRAVISTYGIAALRPYRAEYVADLANEYILNDYLEHYGTSSRADAIVPLVVWSALATHVADPDDCIRVAKEAGKRGLYQYAIPLATKAADTGDTSALHELSSLLERSERIPRAEQWWHRAVDAGDTAAIQRLADLLERTGRLSDAEQWWHRAVDAGDTVAIQRLADLLQRTDREPEAEQWWRRAGGISEIRIMLRAAERLYSAGHDREAEKLWNRAAEAGNTDAMMRLSDFLLRTGRLSESESWLRRAADTGHPPAVAQLIQLFEVSGRSVEAGQWRRRAAVEHPLKGEITKLFIGNLPYDTTNEDLREFFDQYGEVVSAAVIFDRDTGRSKGFGFVEMLVQAANIVILERDGATLGSRKLTVSEARPRGEAI